MAEMCELSDIEMDVVCGGALINGPIVSFGGPVVSFNNSLNPVIQTNVQTGLIFGGGSLTQNTGNFGAIGSIFGMI
jgi:hypothetical protein